MPNPDIPVCLISQLHHCRYGPSQMDLEDAVTYIRGQLVPAGYTPYSFRRDTPESLLDKLRSTVATYKFRAAIDHWKTRDATVYFSVHPRSRSSDWSGTT